MKTTGSWLTRLDARHRSTVSLALGVCVYLLLRSHVRFWTASIAAWDAFAISAVVLTWIMFVLTPAADLPRHAREQDFSRTVISIFAVVVAGCSLVAVGFLLRAPKGEPDAHSALHLTLALLAIVAAWSLTHSIFAIHYAHIFYGDPDGPGPEKYAGGLEFPGDEPPDYTDFAYFSFVVGMTFQVSDVQINARPMRQLVLLHGILSFGFNTIILALAVNTAASLL